MSLPPRGFLASDVALHSGWMRRLARGLVADSSAADDVVQEAWTRLGGARERVGYLAAVVRSLARRWQRSEHRRTVRERRAAREEALPSAADIAARSELAHVLAEAVERLEEPYRTTLVLRYYDDLGAAEIARRAGIPAATVRARLKRGLDVLRVRLDEREGGRERWLSVLLPWTRGPLEPAAALMTPLIALAAMKIAVPALLACGGLLLLWRALPSEHALERPSAVAGREALPTRGVALGGESPLEGGAQAGQREALLVAPLPAADPAPATTPQPGSVRGRLVDGLGLPLRDAWLRLCNVPGASATGDAAGRVELVLERAELERQAALDGGRLVSIEAGAPGHRTRFLRPFLPEGRSTLELGDVLLEPGGAVHGRVVDEAGLPVEGARVAFGIPFEGDSFMEFAPYRGPPDLHTDPWDGHDPAVLGTSGPGGEFHLEGLPAGHGRAWARTATSLWAFSPPIGLRRGEEIGGIELVVREARDAVLTGKVIDPDGRALGGLELTFHESSGADGWFTEHTDADGGFHFAPRWAAVDIRVSSPSWEWEDRLVRSVAPGTHGLVIAFERSQWLQVAVVDAAGEEVRNGRVVGLPESGPTRDPLPRCESPLDASGHARIRRPDSPLRLRVEAPGYRARIVGPIDPAPVPEPLTVSLEAVPALIGRVLRPDGEPAAGARVSLHRDATSGVRAPGSPAGATSHLTHQGWGGDRDAFVYGLQVDPVARVTADEHGHFRLPLPGADAEAAGEVEPELEEGLAGLGYASGPADRLRSAKPDTLWYVHAALEGEATTTSGPHPFEPTGDVELELRLPQGGAIAGRLVLEAGASPAGWTAWASDGLAGLASAPVGPDGAFELANLHAGGWQVRVFEPGRRHYPDGGRMLTEREPVADVEVVAGRTVAYERAARVRACARLAGRLWIDGAAPGAGWVIVRTATPQSSITSHETTLDPDGRFELALEPGLTTSLAVAIMRGGTELTVSSKPQVLPGLNEWSVDLATARLEGTIAPDPDAASPFENRMTYAVERGDVRAQVTWTLAEDGRFGPFPVPAGHGILRGPWQGFAAGEVLAELDLGASETGRVALPSR